MLSEGIITDDAKSLLKSEMLKQLWLTKQTTPEAWERNVFKTITGLYPEEMDFDLEDNHAGYYTWIRAFDRLISELIDDGYVSEKILEGKKLLVMNEPESESELGPAVHESSYA
jgi:hypothetical protein